MAYTNAKEKKHHYKSNTYATHQNNERIIFKNKKFEISSNFK